MCESHLELLFIAEEEVSAFLEGHLFLNFTETFQELYRSFFI